MKSLVIWIMIVFGLPALAGGDGYLYLRYLDSQVIDQVVQQRDALCEGLPGERAAEVASAIDAWRREQLGGLRRDLEERLGEEAKTGFTGFVRRYREAESGQDTGFLRQLGGELDLRSVPDSYAGLRGAVLNTGELSLLPEAAEFLGEVETWSGLTGDVPPLRAWLTRDQAAAPPAPAPTPTPRPVNPLRAAEAQGGDWVPPEDPAENPMDAFRRRREEKRAQALEDAHAGMRQVAGERESWEREKAARDLAKAQADADAMRAQAQRLAAAEEEALAQRENSWGNRLKRIVGGTLSTTIGAFTGGIGAEAGQRAANAVFDLD